MPVHSDDFISDKNYKSLLNNYQNFRTNNIDIT